MPGGFRHGVVGHGREWRALGRPSSRSISAVVTDAAAEITTASFSQNLLQHRAEILSPVWRFQNNQTPKSGALNCLGIIGVWPSRHNFIRQIIGARLNGATVTSTFSTGMSCDRSMPGSRLAQFPAADESELFDAALKIAGRDSDLASGILGQRLE